MFKVKRGLLACTWVTLLAKNRMFRIGISVGRNDLNLEGHLQMGYSGKTIKNYTPIENAPQENNSSGSEEPCPSKC